MSNRCDQILRFFEVLGDMFSYKICLNILWFLGYFDKHLFQVKTAIVTFRATFEKLGLLFILTSGHTEVQLHCCHGDKVIVSGHSQSLLLYFQFFNTVDSTQKFNINFCWWMDLNCGPLVLEATALPTEPQPLPIVSAISQVTQTRIC